MTCFPVKARYYRKKDRWKDYLSLFYIDVGKLDVCFCVNNHVTADIHLNISELYINVHYVLRI